MTTIITVLACVGLACGTTPRASSGEPARASVPLLRVFQGAQLTVQLTADGHILTGTGEPAGELVAGSRTVRVGAVEIPLDQVVRAQNDGGFDLELPVGSWAIRVAPAGEVTINGERWGRVEGFLASPASWSRLEAAFAALPALPLPDPHAR